MTISEMIEKLEKIKEKHGDLPIKTWYHEEYSEQYYLDDAELPEYYKPDEDDMRLRGAEECVIVSD